MSKKCVIINHIYALMLRSSFSICCQHFLLCLSMLIPNSGQAIIHRSHPLGGRILLTWQRENGVVLSFRPSKLRPSYYLRKRYSWCWLKHKHNSIYKRPNNGLCRSLMLTLIAVNTHTDDGGKTRLIYRRQKTGFRWKI